MSEQFIPVCGSKYIESGSGHRPEAEFLDVVGTKVLRVFLLAMHSHLYRQTDFILI
jgi:hypothetical protein